MMLDTEIKLLLQEISLIEDQPKALKIINSMKNLIRVDSF